MSVFHIQSQEIKSANEASKKVQLNLQLADFSLGYQGVAFPILANKVLLGTEYNVIKEVPVYTAIGMTLVPIIPTNFHLETGFAFKGFTVDYSTNFFTNEVWIEEEERRERRKGSNGNLNLGFRHRFGKYLFWLKVGQGISGKAWGSDDDGAFGAKGTHIEFRTIIPL
ncbi:hypothetical protein [Aquimarina sp. AU119]|uniref:hypothetical protein n=1 Tax=Aquimarina sp. AU119 TaxID=2108528 RepID=UPI000D693A40|nr:hypothetical protein [Aquimarina sp. AU119]